MEVRSEAHRIDSELANLDINAALERRCSTMNPRYVIAAVAVIVAVGIFTLGLWLGGELAPLCIPGLEGT